MHIIDIVWLNRREEEEEDDQVVERTRSRGRGEIVI